MTVEFNKLRATALAWLGRQEYYEAKFRQKLKDKEATDEQIELIVEEFTEQNWLSEQRYCNAFVRSRINKGQGKNRIKADAQNKRLDRACLTLALEENDTDWFELALETYNRRYWDKPLADSNGNNDKAYEKEKAKRMRFMQYRGFTMDQMRYAMEQTD